MSDRPRSALPGGRRGRPPGRRGRPIGRVLAAVGSILVLVVTGYGWNTYQELTDGLGHSDALVGSSPASVNGSTNILIMGLDSRLDQNGNPLPRDVLAQLHAGDSSDGGYNTNVLMLLHIPGDGGRAQAISIPRDDYVQLPGSPDGVAKQKIKQAYGLAKDAAERALRAQGVADRATLEQRGREAGRREAVRTVRDFLGGVPIDHFVEVTLVAFYDLARALGSVTVCLAGPTQDSYSGAKFTRGYQRLDAAQALAFVRQRRDYVHPELNFTDLDRERRQQAFLASAAHQLREAGTFADPARLSSLVDVARQDVVLDNGFDPLSLVTRAPGLTSGAITFNTLPISKFGQVDGQDVNLVDLAQIRATVRAILGPDDAPTAGPDGEPAQLPAATLDVLNASGRDGLAGTVRTKLTALGLTPGTASTQRSPRHESMVSYAPDAQVAATALAAALGGLPSHPDPSLRPGHERVLLGTDFTLPPGLDGTGEGATAPSPITSAGAPPAPPPLQGGAIPCVK